jgi:hypothetical protein
MHSFSDSFAKDPTQKSLTQELREGSRLQRLIQQELQKINQPFLAQDLVGVRRDFNRLVCFFAHSASLIRFRTVTTHLLQALSGEQVVKIEAKVSPALSHQNTPSDPTPKVVSDTTKQALEHGLPQLDSPELKRIFQKILKR